MSSSKTILLTGVTGGLGGRVLEDLLNKQHVPSSSIIVTSRTASNRERFEKQGLAFRELDYGRPETLTAALKGVNEFLFMSSSQVNNDMRRTEHQNVVNAAKAAGVSRTWYVSLAFGGFEVNDKVPVQMVHNWTEEMLVEAGINFVSIRAGAYSDAFPLFLNWYPSSKDIYLPEVQPPISEGYAALTSRDELGEGIAALLAKGVEGYPSIQPKTERNIVLLVADKAVTFFDVAEVIHDTRPNKQSIVYLPADKWVDEAVSNDVGGKPRGWFESRIAWFKEMSSGALSTTDPALKTLLGREPLDGKQAITKMLKANPDYTWHQNYGLGSPTSSKK